MRLLCFTLVVLFTVSFYIYIKIQVSLQLRARWVDGLIIEQIFPTDLFPKILGEQKVVVMPR